MKKVLFTLLLATCIAGPTSQILGNCSDCCNTSNLCDCSNCCDCGYYPTRLHCEFVELLKNPKTSTPELREKFFGEILDHLSKGTIPHEPIDINPECLPILIALNKNIFKKFLEILPDYPFKSERKNFFIRETIWELLQGSLESPKAEKLFIENVSKGCSINPNTVKRIFWGDATAEDFSQISSGEEFQHVIVKTFYEEAELIFGALQHKLKNFLKECHEGLEKEQNCGCSCHRPKE